MANFNKVYLLGNITRDPEIRYTPKGTAIARLGLAVNRSWKTESGETHEEATFIDVDAFGRQAETLGQYLRKGNPIFIEGRLRLDTWEDKQTNQKRSKLYVVLENFQFLGSKNEGTAPEGGGGPVQEKPQSSSPPMQSPPPNHLPDDDDVPF
ncbi:MAG TPA: single-stranded DNA-binding protein [Verrucomicrobiales bacterium]|nr:single-stranded DNA-binding protein [Verrucomicrobiales bacterium]HIL71098.1 single-stranded DNA-binding protein [Verrucomicrobiota bacterium]